MLLFVAPIMAQEHRITTPKLDSLNYVKDSLSALNMALEREQQQVGMELYKHSRDPELAPKLSAKYESYNKKMAKNADIIRRVDDKIYYEKARIEQVQRDAELAKQQAIKQAGYTHATRGKLNGYEWVDLGLPSGTKWATCNVGATKPHEPGWLLAWGETKPRKNYYEYTWKYYKHTNNKSLGNIAGNPEYDAATANMGEGWAMPSTEQWEELREHCRWTYVVQDGKEGSLYVSRTNANAIFLPATGYTRDDTGKLVYTRYNGAYWSCGSIGDDGAHAYIFNYEIEYPSTGVRCSGHGIRAVCYARQGVKVEVTESGKGDESSETTTATATTTTTTTESDTTANQNDAATTRNNHNAAKIKKEDIKKAASAIKTLHSLFRR